MRTVCGWARRVQGLPRRGATPAPVASVRPLAAGRGPLLSEHLGAQRRGGVVLDQVDGTTCGSAVLVAMAAWADPAEIRRLDGDEARPGAPGGAALVRTGFQARYDARQRQVHRESTRFWPQALGTTPWGMAVWLRRHLPAAGPYRVRLLDDTDDGDIAALVGTVGAALRAHRPVPLLVGALVPRHYVLATGVRNGRWAVYEPTTAELREVDPAAIGAHDLPLGFPRLHAALVPR